MSGDRPSMAAMVTMIVAMPILGSLVGGALYASELGHRSLALWLFACFALGFVAAIVVMAWIGGRDAERRQ
jgi:hypothetical protein